MCMRLFWLWQEADMAKIYVNLINKGFKTIDDVPEKLREEVSRLLAEQEET